MKKNLHFVETKEIDFEVNDDIKVVKQVWNVPNLVRRIIFGCLMLSTFLVLCAKNDIFSILISLILSIGITYEIISITRKNSGKPFPISKYPLFGLSCVIFCHNIIPAFLIFYSRFFTFSNFKLVNPILFCFYSFFLIWTVILLKRKMLKSQLLLLTVLHLVSYIGGLACALSIKTIGFGKFYFVFSTLLVIANDIFAYFVGKIIGKTPLISLSPNKTLEGLFGGFIFTLFLGSFLSYLKIKGLFYPDSRHYFLEVSSKYSFDYPVIYLHSFIFVLAASFVAPFCGFIASAIKRSFQKKDFGNIIPGHGGFTDRFDCQILMIFFTYSFITVIKSTKQSSAGVIYKFMLDNLDDSELEKLCKIIEEIQCRK